MKKNEILDKMPYKPPFLFIDKIIEVTENQIVGSYYFDEALDFYKGHFINKPITPGVILIETMAQIGLVAFGIFLTKGISIQNIALSDVAISFLKPVFPNTEVTVFSNKLYFRFGKLKCNVVLKNDLNEIVAEGTISGLIIKK